MSDETPKLTRAMIAEALDERRRLLREAGYDPETGVGSLQDAMDRLAGLGAKEAPQDT